MVKSVVDPWGWQHDRSLRLENLEIFRELPFILPRVLRSRVDRRFELLRSLILLRNASSIGEVFRGCEATNQAKNCLATNQFFKVRHLPKGRN
jgi:hypothetical protein